MRTQPLILDSTLRSSQAMEFEEALRAKIVRQEEAVAAMVGLYQVFCAGLNSTGRPIGSLLFLGPTGSGKTRIVEAAAEILFRDSRAVIKVECGEFQHSHEISKLIGSPPGYLGHRETHPLITQEALAASHTDKLKLSFLLFELGQVQQRVLETQSGQFLFRMTEAGREFLLREGTDQRYGARHLKRAIERHVVFPLANLLATGQVKAGDKLCIDWDPRVGGMVFWKEVEASRSTVPQPQLVSAPKQKAAGTGRRYAEVTSSAKGGITENSNKPRYKNILGKSPAAKLRFPSACPLAWTMVVRR